MSNTVKTIEISDLYSTLVGTLDEEKFFKSLCKEIKTTLKCDRISASIFNNDSESILVYSSKKQSGLMTKKAFKSVEHVFTYKGGMPYYDPQPSRPRISRNRQSFSCTLPTSSGSPGAGKMCPDIICN